MARNSLYKSLTAGLNEAETAKVAAQSISDYQKWRAESVINGLRTVHLDGMPRAGTKSNAAETRLVEAMTAAEKMQIVDNLLQTMRTMFHEYPYADIINWTYCRPLGTFQMVIDRIGYSSSQAFRYRRQALCILAVLWPKEWGEIVVRI